VSALEPSVMTRPSAFAGARSWMARFAWCLLGAALLLGTAAFRVLMEGRSELAASDAAWAAGDALGATVHARASARAYVPFAPHVQLAYRRLRAIAQDCEGRGDAESALFAWRAIRAAAIGSRSVVSSHARQREAADAAIARLSSSSRPSTSATKDRPLAQLGERTEVEITRAHAPALAAEAPPRGPWGALLVAGAVLWVSAGVRLTSKGWSAEGTLVTSAARTPLALAVAGLAAWWMALFLV
jgi:hypothetical protein